MTLSVSIIVPVYNVEDYIKDCFASIVGQTYIGPMECLFIDDCGTDNSLQFLERLITDYSGPIKMRVVHHEENRGLSAARNTGITQSKGEYVFFLDSDDKLYPDTIERLSQAALKDNNPDIILGGYQVNVPSHPINQYRYEYQVMNGQPLIASEFLNDHLYCMAPNKLISRRFILDNNLWFKEGIIHEDNLWSFQAFHLAKKVVTIPGTTYYYLVHDDSIMSSTKLEKRLESCKVIFDEVMSDIKSNRYRPIDKKSTDYVCNLMDVRCLRLIDHIYEEPKPGFKVRLQQLGIIHKKYHLLYDEFWLSPTCFMKLRKTAFISRKFVLFDVLMRLAKFKYK